MSDEMRVLTVRQPWAWAIVHGGKNVENRVRNIAGSYRGPIAIHAGLERDTNAWQRVELLAEKRWPEDGDVRGAITGLVELVDVHLDTDHEREAGMPSACRCRSAWAEAGAHHLVLANPRPLVEPVGYRGGLGLRRLDDATRDLIVQQGVTL